MKQKYVPEGWLLTEYEDVSATVYTHSIAGVPHAMAYSGKRMKPDFNFRYASEENREKHIQQYIEALRYSRSLKLERKKERLNFKHTLKVGDILECSWGYDQTNVDFYQVVETGEKTVKIRKIAGKDVECEGYGSMTGMVIPDKDQFLNEEIMLKNVRSGNYVRMSSYSSASLWDGKPCRYSWYG